MDKIEQEEDIEAVMYTSYKTYARIVGTFKLFLHYEDIKVPIRLDGGVYFDRDDIGYLFLNEEYVQRYDLSDKKSNGKVVQQK